MKLLEEGTQLFYRLNRFNTSFQRENSMKISIICFFLINSVLFSMSTCKKEEAKHKGPEEIGKQIGDLYHVAVADTAKLVENVSDPKILKKQLTELKEKIVMKLVNLGKIRKTMSKNEEAQVNQIVIKAIRSVNMDDWNRLDDATRHYHSIDPEISQLLFEINTITQYADFELLKKQAPEEAKRLGIID
ncbi:hypothetical protein ACFL27_20310 [candidate division CSSED10-310 bacterium]|uniref:Uncharacterized protein n=1 Tax=candidate division CSSED10-310 bacterium TaxID=2855610 RepID=A0ABV6Z277_UNCC1